MIPERQLRGEKGENVQEGRGVIKSSAQAGASDPSPGSHDVLGENWCPTAHGMNFWSRAGTQAADHLFPQIHRDYVDVISYVIKIDSCACVGTPPCFLLNFIVNLRLL